MIENKIIIWTSPIAPFQQLYVYKNGERIEKFGAKVENLTDILITAIPPLPRGVDTAAIVSNTFIQYLFKLNGLSPGYGTAHFNRVRLI